MRRSSGCEWLRAHRSSARIGEQRDDETDKPHLKRGVAQAKKQRELLEQLDDTDEIEELKLQLEVEYLLLCTARAVCTRTRPYVEAETCPRCRHAIRGTQNQGCEK